MNYEEAVRIIDSLLVFGSRPGLERIRELTDRLGAPDRELSFVHVAGTNGKGSTCAMTASALIKAGYKTGLFISPYVLEFRERFMINGNMIPEQTLADIVEEIYPVVLEMKKEDKIITEFEFVLAVALVWFRREGCDIVVLETGLGGRFDATNIIEAPLVTAITSISLDHTAVLGDSYEKIAFEKSGIIKENGITVVYGDQEKGAMEVIREAALRRSNRLITAAPEEAEIISSDITGSEFIYRGIRLKLRLIGEHQIKNACTAVCILEGLRASGLEISDEAVSSGFGEVSFPARLELLRDKPLVILDGAHNPGGAEALAGTIKKYLPGKRLVGIAGILADKDVGTYMGCLIPLFDQLITVEPDNPRKMSAKELAEITGRWCGSVTPVNDLRQAYEYALSVTGEEDALLIFGSLYLASDMRKIILSTP